MQNPRFLKELINFDRSTLTTEIINKLDSYIENPLFHPSKVRRASRAAEGLCNWVHALYKYYHVNESIKPKQDALKEA